MKIICIGRNYAEHAKEMKSEVPTEPVFFMKPDTALLKDNAPFYIPAFSNEIHYEGTGPITSLNTIQNDKFTLNSWDGTDTINLMLDVPLVYANIHTGVADLIVSGKSEQLFAYAKGSGTFRMQAFKCTNVYTNNETSSDHYFWAEKKIEALVQYVGNTYYKGNPTEIVKTINNQGKLIQVQ